MKRIKLSVVGSGISIVHVILRGIIISNSFRYFAVRRSKKLALAKYNECCKFLDKKNPSDRRKTHLWK